MKWQLTYVCFFIWIYQYLDEKKRNFCNIWIVMEKSLTHWGWVMHICVSRLSIIGSDNGLSPCRRQAINWTTDGILSIDPLGTNFSEILIEINALSFRKMHLKMSSGKWRPFCPSLNVLMTCVPGTTHQLPSHNKDTSAMKGATSHVTQSYRTSPPKNQLPQPRFLSAFSISISWYQHTDA